MSAKHTPGPWEMFDGGGVLLIENQDGEEICTVELPVDKDKANARLIAAAPCLLSALVGLLDCISETRGKDASDAVCAARAAITKATGEGEA